VIATGLSLTHMRATTENLAREMKQDGLRPLGLEGFEPPGPWVLADYGDVVVHLFLEETRKYYNLERLWGDAPRLAWQESPHAGG